VALVGATERPGSVGATVLRNLREGGFKGQLYPVNPKYDSIGGLQAWPDVAACRRRRTWPSSARRRPPCPASCAGAGRARHPRRHRDERRPGHARDLRGRSLKQAMLDAANPYLLRILGPNSAGLLAPNIGLNASIAPAAPRRDGSPSCPNRAP
jgi:acetyltransferase